MKRLIPFLLIAVLLLPFSLPAAAAGEGYTVSMSADQSVSVGGSVSVPVTVGHTGGVSAFNAVDMTFSYDAGLLELTSATLQGFTVIPGSGTVRVIGYGQDRRVGSPAFTLTFRAVGSGTAAVGVTSARVDISNHAISNDAPEASILDPETIITVGGYPVTLPDGFIGNATAVPGEDYSFSQPNNGREYYIFARVNGKSVTVKDSGGGKYTVEGKDVSGPITITAYLKADTGGNGNSGRPGNNQGGGANGGNNGGANGGGADFDGLWVTRYVELDGSTVFLVAVAGNPGRNLIYAFDGEPMYYTEKYTSPAAVMGQKVYLTLVIVRQGETLLQSEAAARISAVGAERTTVLYGYDVNGSGEADLSDAKLAYDIYNGMYWSFDELPIMRFLNADINLDGMVNVEDAAAIVAHVN